MGIVSSNYSLDIPSMQRLRYDMSRIALLNPTFIWFVGLPGSGRTTHINSLCERLGLIEISVVPLLIEESKKDTDRGKILRDALKGKMRRAPDELVVDLIKEALLLTSYSRSIKGFIINNFPRTKRQANLFVREVKDVDAIIYLFADMSTLITRLQTKSSEKQIEADAIKKKVGDYAKEVKEALSGMRAKVEKVFTEAPVTNVKKQLESAIHERTNIKPMQSISEAEQHNP